MLQGKDKNMNQDDFFENETLGTAFLFIPMDLDHETAEQKMGCGEKTGAYRCQGVRSAGS